MDRSSRFLVKGLLLTHWLVLTAALTNAIESGVASSCIFLRWDITDHRGRHHLIFAFTT